MTIQTMEVPVRGRGRPARLKPAEVGALVQRIENGKFGGDNEPAKKSAASQRGRAALRAIQLAGYKGSLTVRVWPVDPAKDTPQDMHLWAVGPRDAA